MVKKISVRATEIETFQRQTVILPNSELINSAVGNWTHRNKLGRARHQGQRRLRHRSRAASMRCCWRWRAAQPLVLKNPEPSVVFTSLADTAMMFEVRVFVADILNSLGAQNEVRFAMVEALAAEGIGIAHVERLSTAPEEPVPAPPTLRPVERLADEGEAARLAAPRIKKSDRA